jgi:hypothetical protein
LGWRNMLYHVAVRREGLGVANAWRTIPANMCSANSEILRKWHYSVGVFFMEWPWPSHNTAWKSKHRRIQGQFDPLHTVYSRRPVRWWRLCHHDSVPCHKTKSVREWFLGNKVPEMNCPAQSPDLNPIITLVGWVRTLSLPHITNCTGYATALQEEWATILPETFRLLEESQAVIKAVGGPT